MMDTGPAGLAEHLGVRRRDVPRTWPTPALEKRRSMSPADDLQAESANVAATLRSLQVGGDAFVGGAEVFCGSGVFSPRACSGGQALVVASQDPADDVG